MSTMVTLTFSPTISLQNVSVTIISDTTVEIDERFNGNLNPGAGQPVITSPDVAVVTIVEDSNSTGEVDSKGGLFYISLKRK